MKTGCKQADVGMIPMDWTVEPLGRLVTSVEYGSSAKSSKNGLVPVLRMGNLQNGKIDWGDLVYTSDEKEVSKYSLRYGDVLFNRTNTIDLVGKTSIYLGEKPAIFAGYLIRVNVIQDALDSRYLNYILNTEFAKKYSLKVLSVAVGQANINGQKLKTYPIPLPPTKDEQSAIAEALSDVDALLSGLDKLIAKKRDLKQAAMQQLLTGKTRLPGFSGEWVVKRLGEFGVCYRGVSYSPNDDLFSGDVAESVRLLRANNVQNSSVVLDVLQFVKRNRVADHQYLCVGDVLICMANGSKELVGKAARVVLDDGMNYTFGAFMGCYRPNTGLVNASFSFYLFQTEAYRRQLAILLAGSSINNLSPKSIDGLEMKIPARREEQASIAEVLSNMDAELAALEARRDKTRLLKQGMMQELLTGKTRLV